MEHLQPPRKVYVSESKISNAGRGVFASAAITKDEIIEHCPALEVPLSDPSNNDQGVLVNYFFYFGDGLAVALGFGSIYNHSYEPNATYTPRPQDGVIEFKAIRDIAIDEEITVNYNFGDPNDKSQPNVHGIPPHE